MEEERLIDIEIRLTHQQDHLEQLDKVIVQQQNTIDELIHHIERLNRKLKSVTEDHIKKPEDEVPPPHY